MSGSNREKCFKCPRFSEKCYEISRYESKNDCRTTHGRNDTLCWCCTKSVPKPGDDMPCPYATKGDPVKGWDASAARTAGYHGKKQYHVYDCPLFVRGREGFEE